MIFDLRVLIDGLFLVYGVMLTVAGFFTSSKDLAKASQININLWMGLGMLVIAVFFLAWRRLRPLRRDQLPDGKLPSASDREKRLGVGAGNELLLLPIR